VSGDLRGAAKIAVIVAVTVSVGRLLTQFALDRPVDAALEVLTFVLLVVAFTVMKLKTRWLG
jgi:hypothetical protein